MRESGEEDLLAQAGLRGEEDVFASVWASFRNRWAWLAINLVTAFIASRVIGVFEGSIEKLVALAALMPIVAGIGGNSGNQTITMIVRAAALGQVAVANARQLIRKEITVSLVNGVIWGGVMGLVAMRAVQGPGAGARHGAGDDAEPDARRADGRAHTDDDAQGRPRSGGGLVGADHGGHRFGRLLHLPRSGHAVPGVTPAVGLPGLADQARRPGLLTGCCQPTKGDPHDSHTSGAAGRRFPSSAASALGTLAVAQAPAKMMDGVLTNTAGMTLYTFDKDADGKSACNGPCAANWPPLMAGGDAKASGDWSIVTRDDGGKQWAYKGKPVYLWAKDQKPGDKTGDGFNNVWHVVKS